MNNLKRNLIILGVVFLSLGAAGLALSGSDGDEHGGWGESRADLASVANATYGQECGACHLAYQPGLLPTEAWARIMDPAALADHFGDDASLGDGPRKEIAAFLAANAAGRAGQLPASAFAVGSDGGSALPRITETRYFTRKHHEVPVRLVAGNPGVGSFSRCNACHRGAAAGNYNEDRVVIPGAGRWDD